MRDSLLVLKDLLMAEFLVGVVLQQSTAKLKREFRDTGCPTSESCVFPACVQLHLKKKKTTTVRCVNT